MTTRLLGALAVPLLIAGLSACGSDEEPDTAATEEADVAPCAYEEDGTEAAREVDLPPETPEYTEPVEGTITTSAGELAITLNGDTTPCTVNSFASLAEQGFYDDTPCPRIVTDPGFQILQCGDPTGTTGGGPGYIYDDELTGDETYPAGTLAMANSGPDTNGSQFFIVFGDTDLGPQYTTFGSIETDDLSGISEIAAEGSDNSNPFGGGAPMTAIDLESVTVGG